MNAHEFHAECMKRGLTEEQASIITLKAESLVKEMQNHVLRNNKGENNE